MPLTCATFSRDSLPLLGTFNCAKDNDDVFGQLATDWIKCADPEKNAITSIETLGTRVFLYIHTDDSGKEAVAGFGSLGTHTRTIKGKEELWSIIPHLGVDVGFRKYPPGEWYDCYSAQIVLNLMYMAEQLLTPTLHLLVHPDNIGARKLYDRLGFERFGNITPGGYMRMKVELPLSANFHEGFVSYIE